MANDPVTRGHGALRAGKRSKRVEPPPGPVADEARTYLDTPEPAAVGWAYGEPPQLSEGSPGTGGAAYRVVLSCGFDRKKLDSSK